MVVLKSTGIKSTYGRLTYIFSGLPHSSVKTSKRVLACSGTNINLIHSPDGHISPVQNGAYLEKQYRQSLKKAFNPNRRYQAQSIIISFSRDEFDTRDLDLQASQALRIVQGYVNEHFADAQTVMAIQCDANSKEPLLHCHLLINSVMKNGKTIPTSRFTVSKMRHDFNEYMKLNFQKVTCRTWKNPFETSNVRKDIQNLTSRANWEQQLKKLIDDLKEKVTSTHEFLQKLSQHGVTVTERKNGKNWTYHMTISGKKGQKKVSVRDFYQRKDKQGRVIRTRGLGKKYTKKAIISLFKQRQNNLSVTNTHIRKETRTNDNETAKIQQQAREACISLERQRQQRQQLIANLNKWIQPTTADDEDVRRTQDKQRQAQEHADQKRRRELINQARLNDNRIKGPRRPTSSNLHYHRKSIEDEGPTV